MNEIPLDIPGAKVRGQLLSKYDPAELDADMIQVELANGTVIDVGWYDFPEGAEFQIVAYRGFFQDQLCPPIRVRFPQHVAFVVRKLAGHFSAQVLPYSGSRAITQQYSASGSRRVSPYRELAFA